RSPRAQTPTFASPPLSPERAPTTVPSGTRKVVPDGAATGRAGRGGSGGSAVRCGAGIATRSPDGSTATCATSPCRTDPAVKTPNGAASPGSVVSVQPGYEARASSTATATRPGPASASAIVSKCATTAGPRYPGGPSSYNSCAVTVSTVTAPPVPGCLVMTQEPSAATSATGNPGWRTSSSSVKNAK